MQMKAVAEARAVFPFPAENATLILFQTDQSEEGREKFTLKILLFLKRFAASD